MTVTDDIQRRLDQRPLYTTATLAERLGVSDKTMRDMLARGDIPSFKIGKLRRIHPADVDAYLEARQDQAPVGE